MRQARRRSGNGELMSELAEFVGRETRLLQDCCEGFRLKRLACMMWHRRSFARRAAETNMAAFCTDYDEAGATQFAQHFRGIDAWQARHAGLARDWYFDTLQPSAGVALRNI